MTAEHKQALAMLASQLLNIDDDLERLVSDIEEESDPADTEAIWEQIRVVVSALAVARTNLEELLE
ncbi:hypothetical protein [Spirosoma oryzicola]|uniref:hypothetical protein n=1 Tax=Spirosoma oryzicola TaxID=2898794 RepID=UPI001E383E5E|nr:hypothetical protein [Spirosoma oryzicola]UHG92999.1 hypothetical protein LQ777_08875 [Spirosoma oryzicola]